MNEAEQIMKRCQAGTRNYNEANNLHAACYGMIGKLLLKIKELESQEPVAWLCKTDEYGLFDFPTSDKGCKDCFPVFTHPPQRTWVGLTDEEMVSLRERVQEYTPLDSVKYGEAIQRATAQALKEKNT